MTSFQGLEARLQSLTVILLLVLFALAALTMRRSVKIQREAQLELRIEEAAGSRTLRLRPPVTLGRSEDALVSIKDLHVSRFHALMDVEDECVFVEDMGSRNGTIVNARPIDGRVQLSPGDEIWIGRVKIIFNGEVPWT